jgi:hypothetical protein
MYFGTSAELIISENTQLSYYRFKNLLKPFSYGIMCHTSKSRESVIGCQVMKLKDLNRRRVPERNHLYARPTLGRHTRDQHLAGRDANEGFSCPYEGCSSFLGGGMHFLNHTARQHGLTLWCATRR